MATWQDVRLRVVYACDDAYAMQAGVSMTSMLKNNEEIEDTSHCMYSAAEYPKETRESCQPSRRASTGGS